MPSIDEKQLFWLVLTVFTLLLFYRLGAWGVLETSEARYAEMSWEMAQTGDLIHPTFLQLRHYHKPPLTYAITAGAYRLFGPTPFASRVFLQVALLLQLWLMYRISHLLLKDAGRARLATLVYLSFPALLIAARSLTTDLYLLTFLLLGVWCWLRAERLSRPLLWILLAYFAWGLAALTKGAGVVILPAVLLPTYYLLYPPVSWPKLIGRHLLGALLFSVVGLSWYAALIYQDQELLNYFIVEQTIKRYTTDQWYRAQPWWFYLATVSATALPWFWLVVGRLPQILQKKRDRLVTIFLLAWLIGPLAFYSFAQSKLILYVLPIYPGLALLGVFVLEQLSDKALSRLGLSLTLFFTLIFGGLLIAPLFDANTNSSLGFIFWGLAAGAILLGGYGWVRYRSSLPAHYRLLIPVVSFTVLLLPVSAEFLANNELLVNSPQPVVDFLKEKKLASRDIYTLHRKLPAVTFALRKQTTMLYGDKIGRDTTHQANGSWRPYWRNAYDPDVRADLRATWRQNPSVVIGYRTQDSLDLDLLRAFENRQKIGRFTVYY